MLTPDTAPVSSNERDAKITKLRRRLNTLELLRRNYERAGRNDRVVWFDNQIHHVRFALNKLQSL